MMRISHGIWSDRRSDHSKGKMMRRNFLIVAVVLTFGAAASVAAQAKPDFSGKWVMDPASAPAPPAEAGGGGGGGGRGGGRGGGGFGNEFTVAQNAKTLTITRMQGDQTVTTVYNLDGSESKNSVQGRGGAQEQVSKATWDGAKLVVTTQINAGGNTIGQKRVFAMEGGNLTIETTAPGRDGGPGTPTKLVYKKG
jgi:Spy/CpxP family protein refolding chaperone